MTKLKTTLIIVVAGVLFLGSLFLYLRSDRDDYENGEELTERAYRNEELGYGMDYPVGWEIRERRELSFFYPTLSDENLWRAVSNKDDYKEVFAIDLVGRSPLTYIDGTIDYQIRQSVFIKEEDLTTRQWYDIAAIAEAYAAKKITEAEFIRMSSTVVKEGSARREGESIFDPWFPRGEVIEVGNKKVLITTRVGDHRYDGYQYYITSVGRYIFVFQFGYGGVVVPREMWGRSDRHVRQMIRSLNLF